MPPWFFIQGCKSSVCIYQAIYAYFEPRNSKYYLYIYVFYTYMFFCMLSYCYIYANTCFIVHQQYYGKLYLWEKYYGKLYYGSIIHSSCQMRYCTNSSFRYLGTWVTLVSQNIPLGWYLYRGVWEQQ